VENDINIHKNIRRLRKKLGLIQADVAKEIGISPQLYWGKENGVRRFTAIEVYKIAKVMNVDMNIFFKTDGDDTNDI
jgi:transcriptional regulator with XRE-family HTH domain